MSRIYDQRVARVAYELADASISGPTPDARSAFEDRVWQAFERHEGILERLEARLGLEAWSPDVVHVADVQTSGMAGIVGAIMGRIADGIADRKVSPVERRAVA